MTFRKRYTFRSLRQLFGRRDYEAEAEALNERIERIEDEFPGTYWCGNNSDLLELNWLRRKAKRQKARRQKRARS